MENGKWTMEMENGSSTNVFAEGKRKKIKTTLRIIKKQGEKFESSKNSILIEAEAMRNID